VAAQAAPRLGIGFAASVLLHGGVIALFLALRSGTPPPAPPVYSVRIIAAPPGPRAAGVVQEAPPPPVVKPEVPPPAVTPAKPKTTVPVPKPRRAPVKAATPSVTPTPAKPKPAEPQPVAGGGEKGDRGTDVATIDTPGIEFAYPGYSTNIVRQLITRFGDVSSRLKAEVRFVIRRDGTVDPESIHMVTSSGNYSFDQRALGAVEAASNAHAFGPLPGGFREDILPVTFWFAPAGAP
jgi:outer membrane biosynthesis protein TonB